MSLILQMRKWRFRAEFGQVHMWVKDRARDQIRVIWLQRLRAQPPGDPKAWWGQTSHLSCPPLRPQDLAALVPGVRQELNEYLLEGRQRGRGGRRQWGAEKEKAVLAPSWPSCGLGRVGTQWGVPISFRSNRGAEIELNEILSWSRGSALSSSPGGPVVLMSSGEPRNPLPGSWALPCLQKEVQLYTTIWLQGLCGDPQSMAMNMTDPSLKELTG